MRDNTGYTTWVYRSSDGQTETIFNPALGGTVPDVITLKDGVTMASLDPSSGQRKGKGWTPPVGMRSVTAWTPPPPDTSKHVDVNLGWPGMTQVS